MLPGRRRAPCRIGKGGESFLLGQHGSSALERDIVALRQSGVLQNPAPLPGAPPELPAQSMRAKASAPQAVLDASTPHGGTSRPRVSSTSVPGTPAADDCLDEAPPPTAPAGASPGGANNSALARIVAPAWSRLDAVHLAAEFGTPVSTIQNVYRPFCELACDKRSQHPQQTRVWKLFRLDPRLLLPRTREPRTVGCEALLQRTREFLSGR